MMNRRGDMLAYHRQGMKTTEWIPLVAAKHNCTEEAVKRDWSRRRDWIHHFMKLDNPVAMAKKIIYDNELLLLDAYNLYEQTEDPKAKLQIMWLRLKANREKRDFLSEIGALSHIRSDYEEKLWAHKKKLDQEKHPYLKGDEDQHIRAMALLKAGIELPGANEG